uniref:MBL fold metallo-hydrolase n=1 Tax=Pendulispora brunnea TaxID=2905690 RepID=A0ABZ2KLP1_9BACT
MRNEIPRAQLEHIYQAEYMWLSHGHPDHVHAAALDRLANKKILLPNHEGGRMLTDLTERGFDVTVMRDRTWMQLSKNIRAMCISDYHQDAILLIDVGGRLVVNLNDAVERGWGRFVKKVISEYKISFLLKLFGYGDVDMINVVDENGVKLIPPAPTSSGESKAYWDAYLREKVGFWTNYFQTTYMIPFSSFHRYQRDDSIWCQEYVTPLSALEAVETRGGCEKLPAFIQYDCEKDSYVRLEPKRIEGEIQTAASFGDHWSEPLERDEISRLTRYFQSIEFLADKIDHLRFIVGGKEHVVELHSSSRVGPLRAGRSLTFEVPRASLMTAVQYEIFDDLLIGNFMKTTLHGDWGTAQAPNVLYPYFTPWIVRYADNAQVKTHDELREYFSAYRRRAPFDYLLHRLEHEGVQKLRSLIRPDSPLFHTATRAYSFLKTKAS